MTDKYIKQFREKFPDGGDGFGADYEAIEAFLIETIESVEKETRIKTLKEARYELDFGEDHFNEFIDFEVKELESK